MAVPSEVARVEKAIATGSHKELEWSLWYARMRQSVSSARPADVKYWSAVEGQLLAILEPPAEKVYPAKKKKNKGDRGLGSIALEGDSTLIQIDKTDDTR